MCGAAPGAVLAIVLAVAFSPQHCGCHGIKSDGNDLMRHLAASGVIEVRRP
jgi:hypothetical protein